MQRRLSIRGAPGFKTKQRLAASQAKRLFRTSRYLGNETVNLLP